MLWENVWLVVRNFGRLPDKQDTQVGYLWLELFLVFDI